MNLNPKTVARKLIFLAQQARKRHQSWLKMFEHVKIDHLQLDDLITSHHTKLKPLSVTVVVNAKTRHILGLQVGTIPAFGKIAKLSRKKYGKRKNQLPQNLDTLWENLKPIVAPEAVVESDEHHLYGKFIHRHHPHVHHQQHKSYPAAVAGQGELKRKARDPLFRINHTLAMLRANINRLFRRTWNTTKKVSCLTDHLWVYVSFHNRFLIK